jgi:hypothetical protein
MKKQPLLFTMSNSLSSIAPHLYWSSTTASESSSVERFRCHPSSTSSFTLSDDDSSLLFRVRVSKGFSHFPTISESNVVYITDSAKSGTRFSK